MHQLCAVVALSVLVSACSKAPIGAAVQRDEEDGDQSSTWDEEWRAKARAWKKCRADCSLLEDIAITKCKTLAKSKRPDCQAEAYKTRGRCCEECDRQYPGANMYPDPDRVYSNELPPPPAPPR